MRSARAWPARAFSSQDTLFDEPDRAPDPAHSVLNGSRRSEERLGPTIICHHNRTARAIPTTIG